MKKIIYKLLTLFVVTCTMQSTLLAQPPICDTCTYDHELFRPFGKLDTVSEYVPPKYTSRGEYTPCSGDTFQRHIAFVHGLGGSVKSWVKQSTFSDLNYRCKTADIDYAGLGYQDTFFASVKKVNGDIFLSTFSRYDMFEKANRCPQNDFVIAHSQGGIVARYLDLLYDQNEMGDRKFYGLVTFGTPHAGADIALTIDEHYSFVADAVSTVLSYDEFNKKVYEFAADKGYIFGISAQKVLDGVNEAIETQLAPVMLGTVHTPTLDEMKPGTSTMNSINGHQSKLRKVAFYGVENAPECWKVMSNLSDTAAESYPIWQATRDHHLQTKMEDVRAEHLAEIVGNNKTMRNLKRGQVTSNFLLPFISLSWTIFMNKKYEELKSQNKHRTEAVDFLNNANAEWRYLIGSYHRDSFERKTIDRYTVTWSEKYGLFSRWFDKTRTFNDKNEAESFKETRKHSVYKVKDVDMRTFQAIRIVPKFFPSDGVVLQRSQMAFPGVGNRMDKMPENNHFQERNSPETKRVMEKLYEGYYDKYFETLPK